MFCAHGCPIANRHTVTATLATAFVQLSLLGVQRPARPTARRSLAVGLASSEAPRPIVLPPRTAQAENGRTR